jgi:hypothetical protein
MDADDDDDGELTSEEVGSCSSGDSQCICDGESNCYLDTDEDSIPDYLEPDNVDTDGDGTVDEEDPDDDGDGTPTDEEYDADGDGIIDDSDGDGIPDYLDPHDDDADGDSDGDGETDHEECPGGPICPDADGDGIPDYTDDTANVQDGDVTLTGPSEGVVGTGYTFTATVVPTPSLPITYTYTTPEGTTSHRSQDGYTDTFIFTGTQTGAQTIIVTVTNGTAINGGEASDSWSITLAEAPDVDDDGIPDAQDPITDLKQVDLYGPTTGDIDTSYTFTATVPITATTPITYTWTTADGILAQNSHHSHTDTIVFSHTIASTYKITVTASNRVADNGGEASDWEEITLEDTGSDDNFIYLPLVVRNSS